nr:hypothetical protein [Tanacetum cinerariifolium]
TDERDTDNNRIALRKVRGNWVAWRIAKKVVYVTYMDERVSARLMQKEWLLSTRSKMECKTSLMTERYKLSNYRVFVWNNCVSPKVQGGRLHLIGSYLLYGSCPASRFLECGYLIRMLMKALSRQVLTESFVYPECCTVGQGTYVPDFYAV